MGLVVGRTAAKTTVPTIIDFLRRRSDEVDPDAGGGGLTCRSCRWARSAATRCCGSSPALPEGDLTFIREEVTDPDTVRSWASGRAGGALGGGRRRAAR